MTSCSCKCPHGHLAELRAELDASGRAWTVAVAPACCPRCPEGEVLARYIQHPYPEQKGPRDSCPNQASPLVEEGGDT
jgi:hypothetical protein